MPSPQPPTLGFAGDDAVCAAATSWLDWLTHEKRASQHSVDAYGRDLAAFLKFLQDHLGQLATMADLQGLTPADFRAYLARRFDDGLARSSAARALSALRGFFRFLDRRGLVHNAALG